MNKKLELKTSIIKILLCALLIMCILPTVSQAASNGFTLLVNSPSITVEKPSTKKLEAIKVTIKAPTSATINTVTFYNGEKEDANNVFKPSLTSSKKSENLYTEMEYKIETKFLPAKNKSKTIIIYTKASNMESTRKIIKITNKDGKYYAINNAPSISDINYVEKDSKIALSIKSTGTNIKKVEIKDYNANNKVIYSNSSIDKKTATINLNRSKVSLKNDSYYRITVYVYDKNGAYTVKDIAFKLPELKENADNQTGIDNVVCEHKNVKYTTTSTQHTKICKDCGVTLVATEKHIYDASTGKCKVCGYACKHSDTRYLITANTHQKVCETCGKKWAEQNHKISNDKCTVCKVEKSDKLAKVSTNTSPSITSAHNNDKLADVTITVKSNAKIQEVKIYEVDANGNNSKDLKISKAKGSTDTEMKYVLSNTDLLKGNTHYFYITAKNKYGTTTRYYQIKKATKTENKKTVEYYAVNGSPRLSLTSTSVNKKLSLILKDGSGLEYLKIYDINNNNKLVATKKDLRATQKFLQIDLNNYKAKDGIYQLKFEMKDTSSSPKIATMVMKIKLTSVALNIPTSSSTNGSSSRSSGTGNTGSGSSSSSPVGSTVVTNSGSSTCKHNDYTITGYKSNNRSNHLVFKKCSSCNKEFSELASHNFNGVVGYKDINESSHLIVKKCIQCSGYGGFLEPHQWTDYGGYKECSKCRKTIGKSFEV